MRTKRRKILAAVILPFMTWSSLSAAVYMVPRDYDNMRIGQLSKNFAVINGVRDDGSGPEVLSDDTYAVGPMDAKLYCEPIKKIVCRGGQKPAIYYNLSGMSLVDDDTSGILQPWDYVIVKEEDEDNFYLCGGAYSAVVFDDSYIVDKGVETEGTQQYFRFDYVYVPLAVQKDYYWFVSGTPPSSPDNPVPVVENVTGGANASRSYIMINYQQICVNP